MKATITRHTILICLVLCSVGLAYCALAADDDKSTEGIEPDLLKTVVSVEVLDQQQKGVPIGTGFLISHPAGMIALVTAKHVISDDDGTQRKNLAYRLNLSEHPSVLIPDTHASQHAGPWFIAGQDDLALRFIVFNEKADIKALPQDLFLRPERIQPGAPVLIAGFPLGQRSEDHAVPIVRRGIVARPTGQTILVDAFTFPGNSGGPVFFVPTIKVGANLTANFINRDMLVGVVSKQVSYVETAISQQTKRPRVTFEDNAGLTEVVPASAIQKLLNRHDVAEFVRSKRPDWKDTTGEPAH